jgi:hypothetical protein
VTRAAIILLDGARPDVFQELVTRGDLPSISRYLLEAGGLTTATTVLPSTTGVAYLPVLTGCFPGTCDVPGIRWLDPTRYGGNWWRDRDHIRSYCGYQGGLLNHDLRHDLRTLFDIEADSVAISTPFSRGLTSNRVRCRPPRVLLGPVAHFAATYGSWDRAVGRDLVRLARRPPRFCFVVFPGVDGVTHFHDPGHPAVLDRYRETDRILGRYAAAGGFDGDHLTLMVSDHGASVVNQHTDLAEALERRGLRALAHPILWRRRPQVAVMVSGNSSAHLYLAPGARRSHRYSVPAIEAGEVPGIPNDLVSWLAGLPGVGLVAGADGDQVVVTDRGGRARLRDAGQGLIAYEAESGDPLRLGGSGVRLERDWLKASYQAAWPDAPMQLLQLFRSHRTGDLIVMAEPGADLRGSWEIPEHKSGHGSLHGDHMRCLVAGNRAWPGPIRTADLFPVILRHLGHPVPTGIDGAVPATT